MEAISLHIQGTNLQGYWDIKRKPVFYIVNKKRVSCLFRIDFVSDVGIIQPERMFGVFIHSGMPICYRK